MSEHYDFHYQPTGSGAISGQQVLKQTEDAINELGDYVNDNVGGAMDVAQQALETAQNAETNAQTALDTANSFSDAIQSAQQDASTALSTAQTAQTTASNANNTAIQASQDASSAVTTANNASGQVSTLSGTVTALGQRVTTAEGNIGQNTSDITALTTRVGTAEGNITTLQNDVSIAQGNASSAMATAGTVKQQSYVLRYSSTAVTDNSTIAFSTLDNTDNIKSGDKVIDMDGKIFSVVSVDTANQTVTVGSALIDLALDANVVHTSGDETVAGVKTFSDNPVIGSNNVNITVSNRQITANGSYSTPTGNSYSYIQLKAMVNYTDSSPSIDATVGLSVQENAYSDGKNRAFNPSSNNIIDLGLPEKRWANVYATNYYYGSNNVEFSDKFVTTDTNQTISGAKTFSDNLLIYNSDNSVDAPRLNIKTSKYVKGDTTNTDTMRINFLDASGNSVASIYANKNTSGTQYLSFQVYTTDNNNANITSTINYYISKNGDKYFFPYEDNQISLGSTVRRWKSVYATNYYYGSDNVEFSTKFVTTDTNQTISGAKTFSSNVNVYNSDTSAYASYLTLKNQNNVRGSTTAGAQGINFQDKNSKALAQIETRAVSNGSTALNIICYNIDANNDAVSGGISIIKSPTDTNFAPTTDNAVTCGRILAKWSDVQTYQINGLTPSSLSLPDIDNKIDISSYITDLAGVNNEYTPTVNGWICVRSGNATKISILDSATNIGSASISPTATYLTVLVPCVANRKVYIAVMCTSLSHAYFIPCQGNV